MIRNKNIAVTGGRGFIGTRLVKRLEDQGNNVIDWDKTSGQDLLYEKPILKEFDYCFHLAARLGGIKFFHEKPATDLKENTQMTINILDSIKENPECKFVYFSSSMVFESAKKFPVKESDLDKTSSPLSGYGFSKLVGERLTKYYADEFGIKYVIVRPFNAYGPGEMPKEEYGLAHVIPDFIKKVEKEKPPLKIFGDGKQIRCFTYIDDLVEGVLTASEKGENNDFIISSDQPVTMLSLLYKIWHKTGHDNIPTTQLLPDFKWDVKQRVSDSSKIKELGWYPKVDLDEGLARTIQWHKYGDVYLL